MTDSAIANTEALAAPQFVHLRLHSEYSLVDGTVRIKPLMKRVAALNMPAVGLTDHCNFFGLIKFQKAAVAAGVKPIFGADFDLVDETGEPAGVLCLLAMNQTGYRNLIELISRCWLQGQRQGKPFLHKQWLEGFCDGIIALSGGREGDVGQALLGGKTERAGALLAQWQALFPDRFYLELQRTGRDNEEDYLHAAVTLATAHQCPVVATNDVRFLRADEFEAHEARVCIHEGRTLDDPRRARRYRDQQYLRSPEEMAELFSDIPEALANSVEIARRCSLEVETGKNYLPDYPVPEGETLEQFFRRLSHEGLDERLEFLFDTTTADFAEKQQLYRERLDFELNVILEMKFPGYFLIVMDFIRWAREHDIPVGPGRGSGAGSLVAYALKITDLDPLAYDLLFERFLNPERVSMPDFDVDFCMEKRDQVISYVADHYGRDAVSQIITFGTMAAKAVVRDVARVQGKSYGLADKLSKMIPFEVGMTLEKALEQEESLRQFIEEDEQAGEIWEMAVQLEGVARNCGKHAGGVVIAPSKLTDFSPLYCEESGEGLVTQFDKNDVEDAGLVKFDFLGLRTLTIIDWAVKIINGRPPEGNLDGPLDIDRIPLDDPETFTLLKRAETTAVFQLESRGMKDLIKRLLPDRFEDIIALVALFRPGPLQSGMVDDFINRKHGREQVSYPHPQYQHECLEPVLAPTYGIILYQEQVMQIAQEMGGYTLGGADLLRRAMGKKKAEEMAKQREFFLEGAMAKGHSEELASNIFDLMEKFAGYGFNKSHSAAYALVSYQTAWLKVHYPAPFMAAVMSSELDNTDKIVIFVDECRSMNLRIKLPDVNEGEYHFSVNSAGEIIYGLGAIKGLGEGPVESLREARKERPFTDLFDFCARTDPRKVNKRALEALIRAGAFDELGVDRAILMAALPSAMQAAEQALRNDAAGMADMFGEPAHNNSGEDVYADYRRQRPWTARDRLEGERECLGLYVTGHPIDEYLPEIKHMARNRIADLRPERNLTQTAAGLVVGVRYRTTKRGDSIAIIELDDRSARIEVACFSDVLNEAREKLIKDSILIIEGTVEVDDFNGGCNKMRASQVHRLADLRGSRARSLRIRLDEGGADTAFPGQLKQILQGARDGSVDVVVDYTRSDCKARIHLGERWRIHPSDNLLNRLRQELGSDQVSLEYR